MRSIALCALLAAAPALAGWGGGDYSETRTLKLEAGSIRQLNIDAGAGSLSVTGDPAATQIEVHALVRIEAGSDSKAQSLLRETLRLSLTKVGGEAVLLADFEHSRRIRGSAVIDLDITVPEGMALDVEDGSGAILIRDTRAAVRLDDGSGPVEIRGAASVDIDDGSGSVSLADIDGNVDIDDGSGDITIRGVNGNVAIDDGSGSIEVRDVTGNLIVDDDGSGGVDFANIGGAVRIHD